MDIYYFYRMDLIEIFVPHTHKEALQLLLSMYTAPWWTQRALISLGAHLSSPKELLLYIYLEIYTFIVLSLVCSEEGGVFHCVRGHHIVLCPTPPPPSRTWPSIDGFWVMRGLYVVPLRCFYCLR